MFSIIYSSDLFLIRIIRFQRLVFVVYEEDMWDLTQGVKLIFTLENDEEVEWEFKNEKYILRLLVVSLM